MVERFMSMVDGRDLVEEEAVVAVLRGYSKAVPLSTCFPPVRRCPYVAEHHALMPSG